MNPTVFDFCGIIQPARCRRYSRLVSLGAQSNPRTGKGRNAMRKPPAQLPTLMWLAVSLGVVLSAPAIVLSQTAAALTDAEVDAAISAGQGSIPKDWFIQCSARAGSSVSYENRRRGLQVTFSGPKGRIATLAREAKRRYEQFPSTSADASVRARRVFVEAGPQDDVDMRYLPPLIVKVVLKPKTAGATAAVIQPTDLKIETVSFGNLLGAETERNRALALFDLDAVERLQGSDVVVAIVTTSGENTCTVNRNALLGLAR